MLDSPAPAPSAQTFAHPGPRSHCPPFARAWVQAGASSRSWVPWEPRCARLHPRRAFLAPLPPPQARSQAVLDACLLARPGPPESRASLMRLTGGLANPGLVAPQAACLSLSSPPRAAKRGSLGTCSWNLVKLPSGTSLPPPFPPLAAPVLKESPTPQVQEREEGSEC